MRLVLYTRYDLVDQEAQNKLALPDVSLLLEGDWPAEERSAGHGSLDAILDTSFQWIDRQAAELAEQLAETDRAICTSGPAVEQLSPLFLNVRSLRYYLVKLLRPLAYLTDQRPLRPGDCVELVAAEDRDRDYAEVISQLCRLAGVEYHVRWSNTSYHPRESFPPNPMWRRMAARLADRLQPTIDDDSRRRVVLCGNPRVLDPVCRALLRRRCELSWLYDRFAVGSWLRWQATSIRQLVCNGSLGQENLLADRLPERVAWRGVNLSGPIGQWLGQRMADRGPLQTRIVEQIDQHFARERPEAVVVDEDATPFARATVAMARRHGARTFVVQHGAPCCQFGFAPLLADRILVWGQSSADRLQAWGVPTEQIAITGLPQHEPWQDQLSQVVENESAESSRLSPPNRPPRLLLLTTVPPRDARPDAVSLQMTGRSYREMLRTAFSTIAGIDGVELTVKLHPRSGDDPYVRSLRAEYPTIRTRVVRKGPVQQWFDGIDCVLSCGSSAGVEATLAGLPVIQLAPSGTAGFLPHDQWGMIGTARTELELQQLLAQILIKGKRPIRTPDPNVIATFGRPAAERIAEEIVAPESYLEQFVPRPNPRESAKAA